MGDQPQGEWVVPNLQIPRSFGLMNLIFGIIVGGLLSREQRQKSLPGLHRVPMNGVRTIDGKSGSSMGARKAR